MEENPLFRELQERDSRSQSLVQEIVEKARGVFLWVVLVVRSLLTGLRNEDRVIDLRLRLRDFPETLEKYSSHMLDSIEPIYREHTAQTFSIALLAAKPLPLLTYSLLDEEDLDADLESAGQEITGRSLDQRCHIMRRRLTGRYKGLLEVVDYGRIGPEWNTLHVDFLHRTVYDFLRTEDMQNLLDGNLSLDFEPRILLCKALFAQIKLIELAKAAQLQGLQELLDSLGFYAAELELVSATPQIGLMDDVAKFVCQHQSLFNLADEGESGFLMSIVHQGLHLYLVEILRRKPAVSSTTMTLLLDAALKSTFSRPRMVQILLAHGALPNSRYMETTVWGNFLQNLHRSSTAVLDKPVKQSIELLLRHGADRHCQVVTWKPTVPIQGSTYARMRLNVVDKYSSAESILRRVLGDEADEILSKNQSPQSSSKPRMSRLMSGKLFQRLRGL